MIRTECEELGIYLNAHGTYCREAADYGYADMDNYVVYRVNLGPIPPLDDSCPF